MPEPGVKVPRSASPVARAGAGDISERELSRERHNLQTTPPARLQPVHPKKQLFFTPVNKFTGKLVSPSPNLERIRSCLDGFRSLETPARPPSKAKAASMEDLTPTKRVKIERKNNQLPVLQSPAPHTSDEQQAASKICRFMLVAAWRRRRDDVRCLRRTLETQLSYSERLRIQVSALKSLLDSDNAKVRLAMRELERLKQLLRDKDIEKLVLEKEKRALEEDVCRAEDRASELSIGWHNSRNETEALRAAHCAVEHALKMERKQHAEARGMRDQALDKLAILEEDLLQHEDLLSSAEAEVASLRREAEYKEEELQLTNERLRFEQEARERCSRECSELKLRMASAASETNVLREELQQLREQLQQMHLELLRTREQLNWWPRPLTKMMGAARSWFRYPKSVPEAIVWTFIPRYGGY